MSTSQPIGTKKCRFCAETIQKEAVKCRHCGSMLYDPVRPAVPVESATGAMKTRTLHSRTSGLGRNLGIFAAVVLIGLIVWGTAETILGSDADFPLGDSDAADNYDCDDLASEAVRISAEDDGLITLLKVRNPTIVKDNRYTFSTPSGDEDNLILSCDGSGVWSTGETVDVVMRLTIDSDGDQFVYFAPK